MEFTAMEESFLAQKRERGWQILDRRDLAAMPAHIKRRILEFRAKELGGEFEEFRALLRRGVPPTTTPEPSPDLKYMV